MKKIYQRTNVDYLLFAHTKAFKEMYPEATGNYESDVKMSHDNKFHIESNKTIFYK